MCISRKTIAVVTAAVLTSGCASFSAPSYSPHYETIDRLKRLNLEKMSIGEVQPSEATAPVNKISLRGAMLVSPSGTFANYLKNAIRSDLTEMGLYDPASATQVDATILRNDIDVSGFETGYGVMEARVAIAKHGVLAFERIYSVNTQFQSSFAGAVAVPKGQNEYPNLVRALLQKVYGDPSFIEAVRK
jgi:hypothetical protein